MKRTILVFNRLGIGDVVLTTPLAQLIKENLDARVGYVVAAKAADLLLNHPYIDDVFAYSKKTKGRVLKEMKAAGYREAIIVDERFSSMLLAWRAGAVLLNKGFEVTVGKRRLLKRRNHALRAIDDFSSYSRLLGIAPPAGRLKATVGRCDAEREQAIADWAAEARRRTKHIVLVVARTAFDYKNWNTGHLAEFNAYLNQRGVRPVYIGAPADYDYIEAIRGEKINIAGQFGLRDLPALAGHAVFALSMCTGPLHILGTTDLPIIALYGQGDPRRWAPPTAIVLQSALPCAPCLRWADCPRPPGGTCMDEISFARVRRAIEEHALLPE